MENLKALKNWVENETNQTPHTFTDPQFKKKFALFPKKLDSGEKIFLKEFIEVSLQYELFGVKEVTVLILMSNLEFNSFITDHNLETKEKDIVLKL